MFALSRSVALKKFLTEVLLHFFILFVVLRAFSTVVNRIGLVNASVIRASLAGRISCDMVVGLATLELGTVVLA